VRDGAGRDVVGAKVVEGRIGRRGARMERLRVIVGLDAVSYVRGLRKSCRARLLL
jgi:hypothetical protein